MQQTGGDGGSYGVMGKKLDRIAPIVIGAVIALCSLIPVSASLLGRTGHITEISARRFGGEVTEGMLPNRYWWFVDYTFMTENGEYQTGSISVLGDAVRSQSGLSVGNPVRYLAFAPKFNTPGKGMFDGGTLLYLLMVVFGVGMIMLGVRKETLKGRKRHNGLPPIGEMSAREQTLQERQRKLYERLTAREAEVMARLMQGKTYKAIGDELFVTENTVRSHVKKIYAKAEVTSRPQLRLLLNPPQK